MFKPFVLVHCYRICYKHYTYGKLVDWIRFKSDAEYMNCLPSLMDNRNDPEKLKIRFTNFAFHCSICFKNDTMQSAAGKCNTSMTMRTVLVQDNFVMKRLAVANF